jgi:hypothetical protein
MEGCGRMRSACINQQQHEAKMRQPCPCKVLVQHGNSERRVHRGGRAIILVQEGSRQDRAGHDSTEQDRT